MQVQVFVADAERMALELLPRRGEPPQVEVADPRGFGRIGRAVDKLMRQ